MMNKLIITACLAVTSAIGPIASAHDLNPPEWEESPNTTYQIWEFSTPDTILLPDDFDNPYGDPNLRIIPFGNSGWVPDPGAWALGEIDIRIPNLNKPNEYKIIQIQLTWQKAYNDDFLLSEPLIGITATPLPNNTQIGSRSDNYQVVPGWIHSTYNILISPNPFEEWIAIKGDILIDQLVIDTICTPEPATICLLGLGTLTLLRKRRV